MGAFRQGLIAVFFVEMAVLPSPMAFAQTKQQLDWCNGENGATPDLQISGCTAVIQSGRFAGPNLAVAFNNRGNAYRAKGDQDRAIADFGEAIRHDPKFSVAYYSRGATWDAKGNFEQAIADFNEAIRLEPSNGTYLNQRCWTRFMAGRELQLALTDCNEGLRQFPNEASFIDSRGWVYLRLGRLDDALADYNAALKINPKLADSLYGRGLIKLRKGDTAGGNLDIAAAKEIVADIAEAYARYGMKP